MFPFDWKAPFGYIGAWLSELISVIAICAAVIPTLSLIFASSWLFVTITDDDLIREVAKFNNNIKISQEKDHVKLMQRFCDIVQVYSDAKE